MKVEWSPEPLSGLISISLTAGNQSTKIKSIFTKVIMPVGKDNLAWGFFPRQESFLIFLEHSSQMYYTNSTFSNK